MTEIEELETKLRRLDRMNGRSEMMNEALKWAIANKAGLSQDIRESFVLYLKHAKEYLDKETS